MNIDGKALQVPGEFQNRWQKETFYNWLSFASHSFCLGKANSEDTKKKKSMQKKYPAVTVSSNWRTPSAQELTFLHNANNSRLKPLFTLVHVCENTTCTTAAYTEPVTHIHRSILKPFPKGHCLLWWYYYLDNCTPEPFSSSCVWLYYRGW